MASAMFRQGGRRAITGLRAKSVAAVGVLLGLGSVLTGCGGPSTSGGVALEASPGFVEHRPAQGRRVAVPAWSGGHSGLSYLIAGPYGPEQGWRDPELGAERPATAAEGLAIRASRQRLSISNGRPREYSTFRWDTRSVPSGF